MALGEPGTHWTQDDGLHLELRGLAPPAPLVLVLRHIENAERAAAGEPGPGGAPGPLGGVLIAHFAREPMMLYPELAERGWISQRLDSPADEVRLRLVRAT